MNTKFSYMYRDAANYKTFFECVFPGEFTSEQMGKIIGACDDEYFIPRAVGLPGGMFEGEKGYDSRYDHYWCEHDFEDSFSFTNEAPSHFMTAEDLVSAFLRCEGRWESALFDDVHRRDVLESGKLADKIKAAEIQKVGTFPGCDNKLQEQER